MMITKLEIAKRQLIISSNKQSNLPVDKKIFIRRKVLEKKNYKEIYKNAVDELNSYRAAKNRCEVLKEKLTELRAKFYPGGGGQAVDGSKEGDRLMQTLIKIEEFEKKLRDEEIISWARWAEVENKINKLKYPYCIVLRKRYIELKNFEKIAVEMNYDYFWVCKLHKRAVIKYSDL